MLKRSLFLIIVIHLAGCVSELNHKNKEENNLDTPSFFYSKDLDYFQKQLDQEEDYKKLTSSEKEILKLIDQQIEKNTQKNYLLKKKAFKN